ncbi:MAG TPA: hypothetical protein VKH63_01505 [Candidatus Acidoferrum sp.]|nr:hypothetical protein [Candidatus Acidoferrum sp.]
MEYARAHDCAGIATLPISEEMKPPPEGICPGYYLRVALRIASFDDLAIRRASRDPDALVYGAVFSMLTASVIFLVTALPKMLTREGASAETVFLGLLLGFLYVWVYMAVIGIIQIGLCHGVAKLFLSGTGTFAGVVRASLLGWFVNCLVVIPRLGLIAALIAWTAVLMTVLKEVDGLSRSRAFLAAAGVNGAYYLLLLIAQHFER